MGRNILILVLSALVVSALANGNDWTRDQEKKKISAEKTLEERQQRMEILEGDDLGGARGGDEQESQKEKAKHDAEKQKFLYESDGYYRRGL